MKSERFSKIVVCGLGGGIEYGETALNAAKREVVEETGVKVEDGKYIATYEMIGEWKAGKYHILVTFLFKSDLEIPPNFKDHNVDGILWTKSKEILLHPTDMLIFKDLGRIQLSDDKIKSSLKDASITMNSYK